MLQNWFILSPEISLILFLPVAWLVNLLREEKTAKTFFTISKVFLCITLITTVIFYNQSPLKPWLANSAYSTLFKSLIYLVALAWFYLSSKWFLNKNRSSYKFYALAIFALLLFSILISAQNLFVLAVILPFICWVIRAFILLHWDEERVRQIKHLYSFFAFVFCLILWAGVALIWFNLGSGDYGEIQKVLATSIGQTLEIRVGVVCVVAMVLFLLAVAPFHFWLIGILGLAPLPICGFLILLLPPAILACLITLISGAFSPASELLHNILLNFAVLSLFVGAFSANGQPNIRRLFAFAGIYNLGVLLLGLMNFNNNAVLSVFAYEVIYILAMLGVYTVFLGLKSKSEYLSNVEDIRGLSNVKPYLSAAMLVFMFSLVGMPPMLGFLGRLSITNVLVEESKWLELGILLMSVLFMANAFLRVIRMIYFEPLKNTFDRTDKAIYISLFINLILVIISILNPTYVLLGASTILKGVF